MTDSQQLPSLIEVAGAEVGRVFPLPEGELVLGRERGVELAVEHPDVSRRHARFFVTGEGVKVEDLGSKNGVWLRGRAIEGCTALRHGDRLEIGGLALELDHPASRLSQLLAASGEPTATFVRSRQPESGAKASLLWPAVGAAIFALLAVTMLFMG